MKMTEERKALRRKRWANPRGQPEVEKFINEAAWDLGSYMIIPENTSGLMKEIGALAREIAVLAAFADPEKKYDMYSMDEMEALAVFAGVGEVERTHWADVPMDEDIEYYVNGLPADPAPLHKAAYSAPRKPAPLDSSRDADLARKKRTDFMRHTMEKALISKLSRRYKEIPKWVSGSTQLDGWLLVIDRLFETVVELGRLRKPAEMFRTKVKERASHIKPGVISKDLMLPSGSHGGRPQRGDRKFLQDIAVFLRFPTEFYPPFDFEPWTFAELGRLFLALGYKDFSTSRAVSGLMNPILRRRRKSPYSSLLKGPRSYFVPHIRRNKTGG